MNFWGCRRRSKVTKTALNLDGLARYSKDYIASDFGDPSYWEGGTEGGCHFDLFSLPCTYKSQGKSRNWVRTANIGSNELLVQLTSTGYKRGPLHGKTFGEREVSAINI